MAYLFRRQINFDHTQCGSTDSTNFPALIHSAMTGFPLGDMRTVANGGYIQNTVSLLGITVPADLIFTSDAAGLTLLSWEIVVYSASIGTIEIWVNLPTLNHLTTDTIIYMWYGNAAVSTYQCTSTSTWNTDYQVVYHGGDGTTLSLKDSTSHVRHLTNHSATAAAGPAIGGAFSCVSATPSYLDTGYTNPTGVFTIEGWVNFTGSFGANYRYWFSSFSSGTLNGIAAALQGTVSKRLTVQCDNGGVGTECSDLTTRSANTWYHVMITYDLGNIRIFVNGAILNTVSFGGQGVGSKFQIGGDGDFAGSVGSVDWDGYIDEVRFSTVARVGDWIIAAYANQKPSSTFVTIGSPSFNLSDTLTLSDAIDLFTGLQFTDTLSLSDAAVNNFTIVAAITDQLTLTDTLAKLQYGLIFSDQSSLLDAIMYVVPIVLSQSDTLTYTDAIVLLMIYLVQKSDQLSLTDAQVIEVITSLIEGDNILLADAVSLFQNGLLNPTDGITLTDLLNLQRLNTNVFTDGVVLADHITIGLFADLVQRAADQLALSDSIQYIKTTDFDAYIRHYLNDVID